MGPPAVPGPGDGGPSSPRPVRAARTSPVSVECSGAGARPKARARGGEARAEREGERMGRVVSIVYTPGSVGARPADRYARVPLESAVLVAGHGIEGDRKGGRKRHLNIMSAATLARLVAEGFRAAPGE